MKLETTAWPGTYGEQAKPRVGFFTDTSVCIGCKACEVACKEWNQIPMIRSHASFTGKSYDNTVDLGADTWRHVAFVEQKVPATVNDGADLVARGRAGHRARGGPSDLPGGRRDPVADGLRRVQALHRRGLPRRVPDGCALPHRVRHRGGAGGRLQRVRLLRARVPVRRPRPARGRRPRLEVHALLRPAQGRQGAGLRASVPHQLDSVRRPLRSARARRAPACRSP